jgi:hypothetical protein
MLPAMSSAKRWIGWVLLGGVTVAATVHTYRLDRQVAGEPGAPASQKSGQVPSLDSSAVILQRLRRERLSGEVVGTPFGTAEAATRRSAAPAPLVMAPPPFPYRYAGQLALVEGGNRVYLSRDDVLVQLREGEVLDGGFKVTRVEQDKVQVLHLQSGKTLELLYASLPGDDRRADASSYELAAAIEAPARNSAAVRPAGESSRAASAGAVLPVTSFGGQTGSAPASSAAQVPAAAPMGTPVAAPASIVGGTTPLGTLGVPSEGAGGGPLGDAPPAIGSMPMQPAPTGPRLGV